MAIYQHNGLLIKNGNAKMDPDTLIFNMSTATWCPSNKLGFCKVPTKCYATRDERIYPNVINYRLRQQEYWKDCTAEDFIQDLYQILKRHNKALADVRFLRFNEAGDFKTQACVTKAEKIARYLYRVLNIQAYCHTAREDLDYTACNYLLVKGSGHMAGNNGYSYYMPVANKELLNTLRGQTVGNFHYCSMKGCNGCTVCKEPNNMAVIWTR